MSVLFLDQSPVHYESLGRGRPVVFLHSWVGSWRYWVPSMQLASASHSAYALDLFGFGDTAHDPLQYSLERQAVLVERFLEEMGIGRVALVGHGLGALIGLSFASRNLPHVARLMLVAMPIDPVSVDHRLLSSGPRALQDLVSGRSPRVADLLPDSSSIDPRALEVAIDAAAIDAALAALREAGTPCLFVYGANDPVLSVPSAEHTMAFGSNVHQVVLPDAGHFPMFEAADAFNRLLIEFLVMESGASLRGLVPKEEWRRRVR